MFFTPLANSGEGRFVAREQLVAVSGDGGVGFAFGQRRQRGVQGEGGVVVDRVESVRHGGPPVGDPAHRRFVTFGPITRAENVLGYPGELVGDLDAHYSDPVALSISPARVVSWVCSASATLTMFSPSWVITVDRPVTAF